MAERIETFGVEHLDDCARLFLTAFNAEPWNDSYTLDTAKKQLVWHLEVPGCVGLVSLNDGVTAFTIGYREPSVPIYNYFGGSAVTDEQTGLLAYTLSENNLAKANKLQEEFTDFANDSKKNEIVVDQNIATFITISYVDRFQRRHEEVHCVEGFGAGKKVSEARGQKVVNTYNEKDTLGEVQNFFELTPKKLYEEWLDTVRKSDSEVFNSCNVER